MRGHPSPRWALPSYSRAISLRCQTSHLFVWAIGILEAQFTFYFQISLASHITVTHKQNGSAGVNLLSRYRVRKLRCRGLLARLTFAAFAKLFQFLFATRSPFRRTLDEFRTNQFQLGCLEQFLNRFGLQKVGCSQPARV
jgi:hypothetical protein